MKKYAVLLFVGFLVSCKSVPDIPVVADVEELNRQIKNAPHDITAIHKQIIKTQHSLKKQVTDVEQLLSALKAIVDHQWGKENSQQPSRKKYVKYSNDYQARAIIDFENNRVEVETIAQEEPKTLLVKAITTTLLTSSDPNKTDIFSSKTPELGDEPFLYKQVLDHDGVAIRYRWRANRFSEYLVKNQLTKKNSYGHVIHSVSFPLVDNNEHLRKEKFSQYVLTAAKKYRVSAALIYAVIETESSFNPYAVSSANAYGLMQVIPATAGKDVYQRVKKRAGQPSKAMLFKPQYNIDIGSAYLSILRDDYLSKITKAQSKHFAIISSYNGGAGNVLRIFNQNRDIAFRQINSLSASTFYEILITKHPKQESRRYLQKVTAAEKKYQ
ncbi:murein transglycosylase domain-containing protein [Pseudoalteromonas mariniglutinosa]|uniref:murein transglycosylase domain-containing protein n=1 Tax=Pseudoalteromonas mariniglutinosa TaxID=206042 RepID=UPI00384BECF5